METTTKRTQEYIHEHPHIKSCLRKGLINHSALARVIAEELHIETSQESILIASRRLRDKLKKEASQEKAIRGLLENSEVEIKNKMTVFTVNKSVSFEKIGQLQKKVKEDSGTIYVIEGSSNYTVVLPARHTSFLEQKMKNHVVMKTNNVALITLKSGREIERVSGVLAYLTSLFAENGVNIVEFLSCWTDTLFVVKTQDVPKALEFLKF